jgi:hypothetical protein
MSREERCVMEKPEGGLQPMIGYAMHMLGVEGETVASVRARMERMATDRGWPEAQIESAIDWALVNRSSTLEATTTEKETAFAVFMKTEGNKGEIVGVRVVLFIRTGFPESGGKPESVSVVLNVPTIWTPEMALNEAILQWQQHVDRTRYGTAAIDLVKSPGIVAVFQGGFEGAKEIKE